MVKEALARKETFLVDSGNTRADRDSAFSYRSTIKRHTFIDDRYGRRHTIGSNFFDSGNKKTILIILLQMYDSSTEESHKTETGGAHLTPTSFYADGLRMCVCVKQSR